MYVVCAVCHVLAIAQGAKSELRQGSQGPTRGRSPGTHLLGHIGHGVEDGIHGVDVAEGHQRAVGQLAGLVELAPLQAALEDVQGRHL